MSVQASCKQQVAVKWKKNQKIETLESKEDEDEEEEEACDA